jgi:tetratricopeptide (TPR) repeat protein
MRNTLIVLLAALALGACANKPRLEPPAPVVHRGVTSEAQARPAPPPEPTVEVYAYRPPGSAPDAPPPPPSGGAGEPVPSERPSAGWSLPSETATGAAGGAGGAPVAPPPAVAYAPPPPAAASTSLPPAADTLARQAEQQRQSGDYVGAAATLERALRIAPREAYLWNRLARVRLEQGLPAQAQNFASRSNSLSSDATLKQDNGRVIAAARRAAGDAAGAAEAEQKAQGG